MSISRYNSEVEFKPVLDLYEAVGWKPYTKNPDQLRAALIGSSLVLTYKTNGKIVGLVRCVTDGQSICYLQDILVDPSHQRSGIGSSLVNQVLLEYEHIRQVVLMTDAEEQQMKFYEKLGFREIKNDLRGFVLLRS